MLNRMTSYWYYRQSTVLLTDSKLYKMHSNGRLASYIEQVENAYTRITLRNRKQALEILKVRFHNQTLIGALNERLNKEQESNPDYAISCCIGLNVDPCWSTVCRPITAVSSRIAGYVSGRFQTLEIDRQEDGEIVFAVLEHKDKPAEAAHNLFWAHYCNNEWVRARHMAKAMKLVWGGQLTSYYDMMYERITHKLTH